MHNIIMLLAVCYWHPCLLTELLNCTVCVFHSSLCVTHAYLLLSHIFMLLAAYVCYSLCVAHCFVFHNTRIYIDTAHCLDSRVTHCTLPSTYSPNAFCYAIAMYMMREVDI